jgi:hypothetical protein
LLQYQLGSTAQRWLHTKGAYRRKWLIDVVHLKTTISVFDQKPWKFECRYEQKPRTGGRQESDGLRFSPIRLLLVFMRKTLRELWFRKRTLICSLLTPTNKCSARSVLGGTVWTSSNNKACTHQWLNFLCLLNAV